MGGKNTDIAAHGRRDRLIKERVHDPYMTRSKLEEPSVCTDCDVVFNSGRWQWMSSVPESAKKVLCPACKRIRDKVPAGFLTLSGEFFDAHREEIMNLAQNKIDAEKAQHPMNRLMGIEQHDGSVGLTFTDVHLPRSVGEAINNAYQGDLNIQYTEESNTVRVTWAR
jgi:hypothetical protein